jgi:hypothetical protein
MNTVLIFFAFLCQVGNGNQLKTQSEVIYNRYAKSKFTWRMAFSNFGSSDICYLIFEQLDTNGLMNSFFANKKWMRFINSNPLLKKRLTVSVNFVGLYRIEKSLESFSPVGISKFKDAMPFCSFRKILMDWLIDVQGEYSLSSETVHTSFSLVDRCLKKYEDIPANKLQLLGITCLFVASKFCEIVHPLLADMVWVCDNTYTREEHTEMELKVICLLEFQVNTVTPASYICALKVSLNEDMKMQQLAFFLADLGLVEGVCIGVPPSVTAAAAVALALLTLHRDAPINLIAHLCRTTALTIKQHLCCLHRLQIEDYSVFGPQAKPLYPPAAGGKQPLRAVHDRYSREICSSVSLLPPRREVVVRDDCAGLPSKAPRHRCGWCDSPACAADVMARRAEHDLLVFDSGRCTFPRPSWGAPGGGALDTMLM